jgi:hypothetical protein
MPASLGARLSHPGGVRKIGDRGLWKRRRRESTYECYARNPKPGESLIIPELNMGGRSIQPQENSDLHSHRIAAERVACLTQTAQFLNQCATSGIAFSNANHTKWDTMPDETAIFLRQLISDFPFKCGSCGLRPGWESRPPRPGQVLRTFLFRFFLFLVLRFGNHSWLCIRLSLYVNSLDGLFRRFCIRPVFWICLICVFWVWHAGFSFK